MNDNVIKFPKPFKGKKYPKIMDMDAAQIQEDLGFCDYLTEGLMVNLIHNVGENGFDIKEQKFIGDISFLNEVIRGILYRQMGFMHPIQRFIDYAVDIKTNDNKIKTNIDLNRIDDIMNNNDGKEDDTS